MGPGFLLNSEVGHKIIHFNALYRTEVSERVILGCISEEIQVGYGNQDILTVGYHLQGYSLLLKLPVSWLWEPLLKLWTFGLWGSGLRDAFRRWKS